MAKPKTQSGTKKTKTQSGTRKPKSDPADEQIVVRLHPVNKATGHTLGAITIVKLGLDFTAGEIVSGLRPDEIDALREVRQKWGDHEKKTPLAFDILPLGEMKRIIAAEEREKLGVSADVLRAVRDVMSDDAPSANSPLRVAPARRGRAAAAG